MSRSRRTGLLKGFTLVMVWCALAVRIVVPQGYMWSSGANGMPEMTACSAEAMPLAVTPLATAALAAQHHSDQRDHDGKSVDHPCAFAAASAAVDLAVAVHPAASISFEREVPVSSRLVATPGRGLAAPPPPKTGPPAFA